MMTPLIYTDAETIILSCQEFSEENILPLLSDQLRHIFDDLYWGRIMGREKLGSSTVVETTTLMWDMLHSYEVMAEFSKQEIKRHPPTTSIFVRFLITANILEPLRDIYQMKRDIKVLRTK